MGLFDKKVPSDDLSTYTLFITGAKKVGKTSLCAQFPRSFIFEMEVGNARHLECAYEDVGDLTTLDHILKVASKEKEPATWIVDEVNIIYDMIVEHICKAEGVADLMELAYGKGWSRAKQMFNGFIRRIQNLPGGHIYTGHEEEKTSKTRGGREVTKSEARVSKETNRVMEAYTTMWASMNFDAEGHRYLQIVGDDYVKAGHGFSEKHFKLVEDGKIPLGNSPEEAYRNFIKAWNNEPIVGSFSRPKQESPQQKMKVGFRVPIKK